MFLKPIHLVQGALTTPADLVRNWVHRLRKYALKLGLSQPDKYLSSLNVGGNTASWKVAADGHKVVCGYCRHAVASIQLAAGWTAETCSAQGLNDVLNSKHAAQWVQNLHTLYKEAGATSPTSDLSDSAGDLQSTEQSPYTSGV
ncbi:MAG: hypothetical protein IT343_18425 [Candidatus Melainabacteria bacterium]|jgi:hypothetical protein|nr:hypothetical protein [Candidatus Melainabacteria bacterium]